MPGLGDGLNLSLVFLGNEAAGILTEFSQEKCSLSSIQINSLTLVPPNSRKCPRHFSCACVKTLITNLYTVPHSGSLLRRKIIKQNHMHTPSKKGRRWKKKLSAEGTVTAVSIYETRNCISKRIQKFSPSRKLLTRICNKPHSIYMPLNWRALIEIILHSAELCSAKKSSASDHATPEI